MNTKTNSRRPILGKSLARFTSALALSLAFSAANSSRAANFSWDPAADLSNSGGAGTWDLTSAIWNDGVADVVWPNLNDSVAVFGGTGGLVTIDTGVAGTGVTANGLVFNVGGYTIASDEASELLTLDGVAPSINVVTGTTTITSILGGTGGFSQTGGGTLVLNANNTGFTGGVSVADGGVLRLANNNALTNNVVTLNNAATIGGVGTALDLANVATGTGVSLVMNANSVPGNRVSLTVSTGTSTFGGTIEVNGDGLTQFNPATGATLVLNGDINGGVGHTGTLFIRGAGTGVLNGSINAPGGKLNKTDGGTWTINSASISISAVQVSDGTLRIGHADTIPTDLTLTVGQGTATSGAFDLNGFNQTLAGLVTNAGTGVNHRVFNGGAGISTLTLNDAASGLYAGRFDGNMNIVKNGAGTFSIRGTVAGTFVGGITINAGTIDFQADNQLGNTANDILLDGGRLDYTSTTADWDPAGTRLITVGAGGGTLGGSRAIRITDAGQITGAGTLTRVATGTTFSLDIQQAQTGFTGNVVVNSGVIELRNNSGLGNTLGQTITVNGGILSLGEDIAAGFGTTILSHNVTLAGGTLAFSNRSGGTFAGGVNVTSASSIRLDDFYSGVTTGRNRSGTISGVLSGSASLTVTGKAAAHGTLIGSNNDNQLVGSVMLTNPGNTYSGTFTVGPAAALRSVQSGGINALGASTIELASDAGVFGAATLGLASKSTAAGTTPGLFARYYGSVPNLHTANGGYVGGLDYGSLPVTVSQSVASATFANLAFPPGVGPNQVAILYTGILEITNPGSYQFSTSSDDGSILYVDGQPIVINDLAQAVTNRVGAITLDAGFHNIVLKFAQGSGGGELQVFNYRGPDTANVAVTVGSIPGTLTNNGSSLFAPTAISQNISLINAGGDIDLGGANGTSTGTLTFGAGAALRVTGITGFETLTQSGPVVLNGTNTVTSGVVLKGAALSGNPTSGSAAAAAATNANTNAQDSSGADIVISGVISEAVAGSSLVKNGPRKLTLSNTGNSFTGQVTINAGTLTATTAQAIGTAAGVTIGPAGTLDVQSGVVSLPLDGTGLFLKTGAGTTTIDSSSPAFTGLTRIAEGTLTGSGSLGSSTVTVINGAAIGGSTGSTFTIGGLTLLSNSNANFALGAPSLVPLINVVGATPPSAVSANLNFTNAGGLATGSYRLIDYAGPALSSAQFAGFGLGTRPAGFFFGLVNNTADTAIDLSVETAAAVKTWTGATDGVWDTTTANWTPANYVSGEQVVFGDGPTNRNIVGGAVTPQSITMNAGAGNDYVIANNIGGTLAGGLAKSGASILRLTGANTFTGPISVTGGTLRADVSSTTSALGAGAVSIGAGATLQLDPLASTATNGLAVRWLNGNQNTSSVRNWTATAAAVTSTTDSPNPLDVPFTNVTYPGGLPGGVGTLATPNWTAFAYEATGKLRIDTAGLYGFLPSSDDATRVFINGKLAASNDGGHGVIEGGGALYLDRGLHDIRIEYAQGTGGSEARIRWAGPGIARGIIPNSNLFQPEVATLNGTTSNVIAGTPISVSGNATVVLGGSDFTGIEVGAVEFAPGSTLNVTGQSGKLLRSTASIFTGAGTFTINNSANFAPGRINDLGNVVSLVKQGEGRLLLDYVSTSPASTVTPGFSIEVQDGTLAVTGSKATGVIPLNGTTLKLNGGDFELNVLGSWVPSAGDANTTWTVPINVQQDARMIVVPGGVTTTMTGAINISSGATFTIDTIGGTRSGGGGLGGQLVRPIMEMQGLITGGGGISIESNNLNGGQSASAGTVRFNQNNTYTGLTRIQGYMHTQTEVELKGTATFLNTSGVNDVGALTLNSARLKLQNNAGGALQNRIPDAWPVNLSSAALQLTSPPGTSINEVFGTLNLVAGQNLIFAETNPNAGIFHTMTWAGVNRTNRSTLRLDQHNAAAPGQSNMGSLTATNGYRLMFTDSSGFNLVGGGAPGTPNTSIIPWVWAQSGLLNERMFVTYGANGLRPLEVSEYITALGSPSNTTENLRISYGAATTIGDGLTHTVNSLLVNDTATSNQTLTLAAGTTINITSGALMLTSSDGTARAVTLAGGTINFGAAEGIIIPSRAVEHHISSQISGSNGITISGDGRLRLSNASNNFTGLITIGQTPGNVTDNFHLTVDSDGALGNSDNDIRIDGATFRFQNTFTMNVNRTVTLGTEGGAFLPLNAGGAAIAGVVTGPGAFHKIGTHLLSLTNPANDYTGPTYVLGGDLVTNSGPQGDIYAMNSAGTVIFAQSFDGTYTGDIHGLGSIVKTGIGTVTTTGTLDYVGTTLVTNGGFFVNGSIKGSTTTVTTGTLGGDGSIAFDVNVGNSSGGADAFLDPGSAPFLPGSLSTGNFTFGTDATYLADAYSLANHDQVNVTGSIALNGATLAINPGFGLVPGDILFLMVNDGADAVSGQFAGIPPATDFALGPFTFQVSYDADLAGNTFTGGNDVALLVVVPEPGSAVLLLGGLASLAAFRRRRST